MRKKTREELDRLRKDVNDLNVMLSAIAAAARIVPIRVAEQHASTHWVSQDSDEWKAECERRQKEGAALAAMARAQASSISLPSGLPGLGDPGLGDFNWWG